MGATSCSINSICTHFHYNKITGKPDGDSFCLKCQPMEKEVSRGNFTKRFFTMDFDQLAEIEDDRRFPTFFEVLRLVDDPVKREIFLDHEVTGLSLGAIAEEHGMTKAKVQRIVREVRHDCKKYLGLSTVF